MSFWIKITLVICVTCTANQIARSEPLWNAYYGAFGTQEELDERISDLAISHLIDDGAAPEFVNRARAVSSTPGK